MQVKKTFFIVSGEESGDIYASEIAKNLKIFHKNIEIFGIGGENLLNEEVTLIEHIKNLSFLGLFEVVKHIPDVLKILKKVKNFLKEKKPENVILIDFPDFNFQVAKFAKKLGLNVFYFITPQIWAWREGRVKFLKKYIDKIFVIFPFEEDFYKNYGIDAKFVGHPLAAKIKNYLKKHPCKLDDKINVIGLLPGSRKNEINIHFPIIVDAVERIKNVKFLIAAPKNIDSGIYKKYIHNLKNFEIIHGDSYKVMSESDLIISTSGTATLESALFGKPVIIIYRVNFLSYILGRLLIKVPYIGMPNLLLGEMNNPELIQFDCNSDKIYIETIKLIKNFEKRKKISDKNKTLMNMLYKDNIFDFLRNL